METPDPWSNFGGHLFSATLRFHHAALIEGPITNRRVAERCAETTCPSIWVAEPDALWWLEALYVSELCMTAHAMAGCMRVTIGGGASA
jgi:hypothetical protein